MDDLPPAYGDVTKDGVAAQYQAYENYGQQTSDSTNNWLNLMQDIFIFS